MSVVSTSAESNTGQFLTKMTRTPDKVLHLCGSVQGEGVLCRAGAGRNEGGQLLDRGELFVACHGEEPKRHIFECDHSNA